MEVIEQLAVPLPVSVISRMLGIPEADFPSFKAWADDFFAVRSSTLSAAELVERAHRGIVGLSEYLHDVLDERTKHPGDDLLSLLVHAREQGKALSSDEIVATSALLLLAGYETTTHLIAMRDYPLAVSGGFPDHVRRTYQVPRRMIGPATSRHPKGAPETRLSVLPARRVRPRLPLRGHRVRV